MRTAQNRNTKVRKMVFIAMMSAVATLLMLFEFPLPFLPPFLKLDISAVPVLIGSYMFGPMAGVAMAAVKAVIHLIISNSSAGVGQLADFIITSSMAITGGLIYKFNRSRKGALIASFVNVFVIVLVGTLANYFIIIPFYAKTFMPMEAILELCQTVNPNIQSMGTYILYAVIPFNLIKGSVISLVTFLLYKRISNVMQKFTGIPEKSVSGNT